MKFECKPIKRDGEVWRFCPISIAWCKKQFFAVVLCGIIFLWTFGSIYGGGDETNV